MHSFCGGDKRYCSDPGCQPLFGLCHVPNSSTLGNPACSWSSQGTSPRCDGQCGIDHNNALCDASAAANAFEELGVFGYGPCCSKAGFCGNTSEHCEQEMGCQSGCWGSDDDDGAASTSSANGAANTVTVTATATASATGAARVARGVPEVVVVVGLGVMGMMLEI
ncbi:glyoxal oxidase [Diplodia corticola]|uniref:Glyoxal oxidase n=1 Tax=Diplodia corticola TaxID=236234 RepID=A0A1J9QL26_9PEZI|nr:glyoxal oxidase [Diplodia corticola]OJD29590.1 glyoxal oxidase [Diplodia corticola]